MSAAAKAQSSVAEHPPFADPAVEGAYAAFPEPARAQLLTLRALAFEVAEKTEGAGQISEALKWGQPSFVTTKPKGSTFRLGAHEDGAISLYFLCQTSLVETFRERYPDLDCIGTREIRFAPDAKLPTEEISHCMALAMTYGRW
ncbi:MAG: DUF1801 domain-containing protein [Pseudomonadota bacterium]